MSKISLRQLRIFAAVAERGNLAAAGRDLRLSQATLSQALRDLEGNLGLTLFDRANRRLRLTSAGWAFLTDARGLLDQSEALYRRHSGRSRLTCGASVTVANYILPPILIALVREQPDLEIELVVRNTEGIVQRLLDRKIQAAVVEGRAAHSELETIAWRQDALAIIAPPDHPLTKGATPELLSEAEWILRERGSGTRESFDAAAEEWPRPPKIVMTAGGNEFIKQAVAAGRGLGCLSRAAVQAEIDRGELALVPVAGAPMVRTLTFLRRADATGDPSLVALMAALGLPGRQLTM